MIRPLAFVPMLLLGTVPAVAQNGGIAVVTSGSEQSLKVGQTIVSRPFGAQLVDRISVVGSYRSGKSAYHLVRGEAGGDCRYRYVVVTREADGNPAASEPFGTCSSGARGEVGRNGFSVAMPATAAGGPLVRFRYDGGAMRLIGARPSAAATSSAGEAGYGARAASTCAAPTSADPATQVSVVADFQRDYPVSYRKISTLKKTEIAPEELRATVTGLACLARWPGAQDVVPEAATPLFASKRYGADAFAALDTVAKDPLSDVNLRAAVRAFNAEMIYRVDRREPL